MSQFFASDGQSVGVSAPKQFGFCSAIFNLIDFSIQRS